jgi:hypothetical protein
MDNAEDTIKGRIEFDMKKELRIFTESTLLAAIPALGYWVAFVHELGYFSYFEIPATFIEVALNSILLNSLSVVSGLGGFLIITDFLRRAMSGVTEALKFTLYKLLFAYFFVYGFGLVFNRSNKEIQILLLIFALPIICREILWPMWKYRHLKGLGNKVAAAKAKDFEFDSALDKVSQKIGAAPILALVFVYLLSVFSYLAGGYSANKQTSFFISDEKPNYVLIRTYNENWLAVKIDKDNGIVLNTYELVPLESIKKFSNSNIGRLEAFKENADNVEGSGA